LDTRSAFIAVVGSPNVGKSTLVNFLVGEKVSIVSPKPQTTRNRISGILTGEDYQIVFLDTPGIHEAKDKLGEYMVKVAYDALREVDAVLFMCDAKFGIGERDKALLAQILKSGAHVIAVINKMDAAGEEKTAEAAETVRSAGADEIYIISAKTGEGTEKLLEALKKRTVPGPFYYPEDYYTDQSERAIAAEIIREKALGILREEVPHGIGVSIEKIAQREGRDLTDISAVIICEKDSHKAIIIGRGGQMLRRIGTEARKDLEELFGMKVFLELFVKIEPLWRDSRRVMRDLGYE
jgi:GTPase